MYKSAVQCADGSSVVGRRFERVFESLDRFQQAVETLMTIRRAILGQGRELCCRRDLRHVEITRQQRMAQAIQSLPSEKRRAWTSWIANQGPHWEDRRLHPVTEWFERNESQILTDTCVGEAAYRMLRNERRYLVSVDPSEWLENPLIVFWRKDEASKIAIELSNHWSLDSVKRVLASLPRPYGSWDSLRDYCIHTCYRLAFSDDAFDPLHGHPFVRSVADRTQELLTVLHSQRESFDTAGWRSPGFEQLHATHFRGESAHFSDESDTSKRQFESRLTFPHPEMPGKSLFCPWHGKPNCPTGFPPLRIHFSWPINELEPTYVVYIGPKITTR